MVRSLVKKYEIAWAGAGHRLAGIAPMHRSSHRLSGLKVFLQALGLEKRVVKVGRLVTSLTVALLLGCLSILRCLSWRRKRVDTVRLDRTVHVPFLVVPLAF